MDTGPNIIDKDGLRSMYEDGWIIDKNAWFMDKYWDRIKVRIQAVILSIKMD